MARRCSRRQAPGGSPADWPAGKNELFHGNGVVPATRATVQDILKLKEKGISDEVIHTIVQNQAVDPTIEDQRRAMQILKDMNLLIDVR